MSLLGTPPSAEVKFARHPMHGFASGLGRYLLQLLNSGNFAAPPNPYRIDLPLTPTNEMWGRMAQQYSASPAPYIMGQAAGTLGQLMNPNMNLNAMDRLGGMFAGQNATSLFTPPGG